MAATQPEASRNEEIRLIWKEHQWLYVILGFALGVLVCLYTGLKIANLPSVVVDFLPEIIAVIFTVRVIDHNNRLRDDRNALKQLQEQLVRDARSSVNDVAVNAVHQLRERGWLGGPESLLAGANLSGANLQRSPLYGANLQRTHLGAANLVDADLFSVSLQGAQLRFTDLHGANLAVSNLQGATLVGSNLRGAVLRHAKLHGADLGEGGHQAKFDETTILPDGTHWTPDTDMTLFTYPERHTEAQSSPAEAASEGSE
jgi:hypothetical protein